MTNYVAGFLFSPDLQSVVLIEKQKPAWQKEKYNGIGGKIEDGETSYEAQKREFEEETGVLVISWNSYVIVKGEDYTVEFFWAISPMWHECKTTTDEQVEIIPLTELTDYPIIENLNWLIPLAVDKITNFSGEITMICSE